MSRLYLIFDKEYCTMWLDKCLDPLTSLVGVTGSQSPLPKAVVCVTAANASELRLNCSASHSLLHSILSQARARPNGKASVIIAAAFENVPVRHDAL